MADLIRIAIVEDHPATAHGLGDLLSAEPDIEVVGIAGDLAGARRLLREARPDVLLCDIELPDGRAFELLAQCHGTARVATILFSSYDYAAFHQRAHELGAAGYLLKTATTHEIVTAVRTVAVGGAAFDLHHLDVARTAPRPPSERNLELIRLVAGGSLAIHGYPILFGDIAGSAKFLASVGLSHGGFWVFLVGLVEFGGGLCLALGHPAAYALAVFGCLLALVPLLLRRERRARALA